jgi:hypothetical protein
MGNKPYKDWEEVKKDIVTWRRANLCCIVIGLLLIIAGAVAETIDIGIAPTSLFLVALFFAVLSIAPHIHVMALKSWYGVESERKNK